MTMTFKLERLVGGENAVVLRVCGADGYRMCEHDQGTNRSENTKTALDLSEVTLADRDWCERGIRAHD
jgi:hypothetical protein